MALKIEYETDYGINCEHAICVIEDVMCTKLVKDDGKSFPVTYMGHIYASSESYESKKNPIGRFSYAFDLDGSASKNQYNLLKQSYLDLKTKKGFTDGIDC